MCKHGLYAGVTASDDEVLLDCPRCEKEAEWAEEDRRDRIDEYSGIRDDEDVWF